MRAKLNFIGSSIALIAALSLHGFSGSQSDLAQTKPPAAQSGKRAEQTNGRRGDVISEDYLDLRPSGKNTNPVKSSYLDRHPRGKQRVLPQGKVFVRLGVTIGRGRPATEAELKDIDTAKVRMCAERLGKECTRWQEMAIERITDNSPITNETLIQMMIEYLAYKNAAGTKQDPNRVGYLYVINRVQFPDGKTSPPRLIYPTKITFGGDGRVLPGKIVMLPAPQRLWQITRNKDSIQAFETYIIVISPEPLKDAQGRELQGANLSEAPLELDEKLVANWLRWWGRGEIQADLERGVGQLFTQREQSASGDPTKISRDTNVIDADLTQDDPRPQMVFRKAITTKGKLLITIKLPFKDTASSDASKP